MNCDVCQSQDATVYFTQIVEGKMQKVNLCESCAQQKGVNDPTGFQLADLLKGLGSESESGSAVSTEGLRCQNCGFTQSDFKKTGRFGCSLCYQVFSDGLDNLLEAMHRHTMHAGKTPANFSGGTQIAKCRLDELHANLEASVDAENYEEAARLRDAISELESKISSEPIEDN
jgi:protein arginine kinase activator